MTDIRRPPPPQPSRQSMPPGSPLELGGLTPRRRRLLKLLIPPLIAFLLGVGLCRIAWGQQLLAQTVITPRTITLPIAASQGGTGISSYAVGDILYANTTTTLARLADIATGSYLRSGGVGVAPLWSTLTLPNAATTGDVFYASAANTMAALADVAAGSYLRSGGVGTAPLWSTLTMPNTATTGDLPYASAANVYANLAGVAAGSYLRSGGVGTAPVWSTLIVPNAATVNRIVYATATDTWGGSADLTYDGTSFAVGTVGPHAIGGASNASFQWYQSGNFPSAANPRGYYSDVTLNAASGGTTVAATMDISGTIVTQAAVFTLTDATSLLIQGPILTIGAGSAVSNASSIKIVSAPTGATNNYALWVDAGIARLDGAIDFSNGAGAPGAGTYVTGTSSILFFQSGTSHVQWNNNSAGAELMRLTNVGNLKIGGTATRATTEGTNKLELFDGTAPVGTLAAGISLYSTAGELRVMDSGGTATLLSPHNKQGEWIFFSKNTRTGQVLRIDMERLMRLLDTQFGGGYIHEYVEMN